MLATRAPYFLICWIALLLWGCDAASPPQVAPQEEDAQEEDADGPEVADSPDLSVPDLGADVTSPGDLGGDAIGEDIVEEIQEDTIDTPDVVDAGEDAAEDAAPDQEADLPVELGPDLIVEDAAEDVVEDIAADVVEDVGPDLPPAPVIALEERPINGSCVAPPRPPPVAGVRLERAFPNLSFASPVGMFQAPGDDTRWYVLEQTGRIMTFEDVDSVAQAEVFADFSDKVACCGERGLLGLAFHPEYASNRRVFVSYTFRNGLLGLVTAIHRLERHPDRRALDRATEALIFQVKQPYGNHNGGSVAFGPDGYLYAGYGDGGAGGDPLGHGQNLETHLGSMVRLDVDGVDTERMTLYRVPADNPFVGVEGAQPEIWAYGLRNPWKFSFDVATGDLWAADVGQSLVEEVDLIVRGGNYGWKVYEGTRCYSGHPLCGELEAIDPVVEYVHEGRASVTGGFVYRGDAIPELAGAYIYADYASGRVWAAMPDPASPTGYRERTLIQSAGFAISSFGQGQDGEVYLVRYQEQGGAIYRLVPDQGDLPDNFPQRLSQTGCVNPARPWEPAAGVLPYALNVPFWSDNAEKERWMAIPDGTQIEVDEDGDLLFPPGSVTIKHFRLGERLIETRLLVRHDDGEWAGYTYAWREDEQDADLLEGAQRREVGEQVWRYPSRAACLQCHNAASNYALGPELRQLNRAATYFNGVTGDQLATLSHIGLFAAPLPSPGAPAMAPLAATAGSAPLGERARSYLHANCAYCHRPGGPGRGELDLRVTTPDEDARLCGVAPEEGDLGLTGALIVDPGDPARSLLWERMRRLDDARMPSTLSTVLDAEGLALTEAWIRAWERCEDDHP
jgi:uncharacterized repeat protein (TIGR03806 family)